MSDTSGGGSGGATGGLSVSGGAGGGSFGYWFGFQPRPMYSFQAHHHKIARVSPHRETKGKKSGRTGDIGRGVGRRSR